MCVANSVAVDTAFSKDEIFRFIVLNHCANELQKFGCVQCIALVMFSTHLWKQMSSIHSQAANKFPGKKIEYLFHNCFTVQNKKAVNHC